MTSGANTSRPAPIWSGRTAILCIAWLCAGCAQTGTTVVSKTDGGAVESGQRVLVVSQLAWVDKAWAEAFEKAMLAELRQAGFTASIQTRNPLALHGDKEHYATQIAEFKPDMVLVVEPGDGTIDQSGRSLMRRFEAGLFMHYAERGRELTWRATVKLDPAGAYITSVDMPALARDLMARLSADRALPKRARRGGAVSNTAVSPAVTPVSGH